MGLLSSTGTLSRWLKAHLDGLPRYRIERAWPSHRGVSLDAYDENLHRRVVLRVYGPEHAPGQALEGARAASRVRHRGVVEIHDAGELGPPEARTVYVAIERLAPSRSLRAWLANDPSRSEVHETFDALARGLQAAHEAGVVHGGLDGAAARVCADGRVVLIEFRGGAATAQDDQRALARLWLRATARWRNPRREAALRRAVDPVQRAPFESVEALRRAVAEAERSRPGPWIAAAGFASLGGAAAMVWWAGGSSSSVTGCAARVEAEAERTWSPERSEAVRRGLLDSGSLHAEDTLERLVPRVDAYVARWQEGAAAVCEAGSADPRVACYAEARAELHSLLALFEGADRGVAERALKVALQLPALDACDARSGAAADEELSRGFGRLSALRRSSRLEDAHALATTLLAEPGLTPALQARLYGERAYVAFNQRRYDLAAEDAETSYMLATGAGASREQVNAAALLVSIVGYHWRDRQTAEAWLARGRAAAEQPGVDPVLTAVIDKAASTFAYGRGDYVEALALIDRAIATRVAIHGEDDPIVWGMRSNRASTLRTVQRTDEAIAELRGLLDDQRRTYGTMTPAVAQSYNNLGSAQVEAGHYTDAIASLERAIEIWRASKGPDFPDLGMAYSNLGHARAQRGDLEGSLEPFHAAAEVWTAAFGPEDFRVGIVRNNLSAAYARLDRFDESATESEAAYRIQKALSGAEHPDNVYPLTNLANVALERGRLDEARAWADEAVRITTGKQESIPLEFSMALTASASVRLREARTRPSDAQLRARALAEMRSACAASDVLPEAAAAAGCYQVLADALFDFGHRDARAVAQLAIERIDASESAAERFAEARARLVERSKDPP